MRSLHLLLVLSIAPLSLWGQSSEKDVFIYGGIRNMLTNEIMTGVKAEVMTTDSVVVDTTFTGWRGQVYQTQKAWLLHVPKVNADYIVRFSKEGFETKYLNIKFRPNGRRKYYDYGTTRLIVQRDVSLKEAEVTATKVKFYTKKDTIVFNASAFQLAEGSMLDALIRQLPGVELKDDGRILVNGKQVESLLLNGDDFFKGNNQVMLDNLPSYMVKDVRVYDKRGRLSEFMDRNIANDKSYVMDVKLKREYSIGWIGNVDVGGGTEDRYLARLFAMRFTPQSRVSLFGNMNNLTETRKPGESGDWTPQNMPKGIDKPKTVGVDYSVKDRRDRFRVEGQAQAEHLDRDNEYRYIGERFLTGGNTYSYLGSRALSCNTTFSTSHTLELKRKYIQLFLMPSFYYTKWDNRSHTTAATFSVDPERWEGIADSINHFGAGSLLAQTAINRTRSQKTWSGHQLNLGMTAQANIKFRSNDDILSLVGYVSHDGRKEDTFDTYRLDYPAGNGDADNRNRYFKDHPNTTTATGGSADYWFWLPGNLAIIPSYSVDHTRSERDYALYRLDQLSESSDILGTGMLPSESELLSTVDAGNSYYILEKLWRHTFRLSVQRAHGIGNNYLSYYLSLPIEVRSRHTDYFRAAVDTTATRNDVFFNPSGFIEYNWHKWQRSARLDYSVSHSVPSQVSLFGRFVSDSDPLSVSLGNAGLKNATSHNLSLSYKNNSKRKQRTFGASAAFSATRDAIAYAYHYDRATGVTTYMPRNVNGNWSGSASADYSMPLDKQRRLMFSTGTSAQYYNSVDYTSTTAEQPMRSKVRTLLVGESLKLDYSIGSVRLGVKGRATWHHATSARADFSTVDAADFNYGLTAKASLPWKLQLSTDFTVYSRRGYDDEKMNTDDLVWNARLARTLLGGRATVMIDGFDMLHQLSALSYSVNAQGRTETYRNVIPRYVMLHVIYRLNIKPKGQPGK